MAQTHIGVYDPPNIQVAPSPPVLAFGAGGGASRVAGPKTAAHPPGSESLTHVSRQRPDPQ